MGRSRPAVQMLWMRALHRLQAILAGLRDASSIAAADDAVKGVPP